jgi:large subunit ribosomal protein L31
MKNDIHPKYYSQTTVKCSCGHSFITGSTKAALSVEICNNCHPFFTGEQRIVDTEGRVDRIRRRFNLDN